MSREAQDAWAKRNGLRPAKWKPSPLPSWMDHSRSWLDGRTRVLTVEPYVDPSPAIDQWAAREGWEVDRSRQDESPWNPGMTMLFILRERPNAAAIRELTRREKEARFRRELAAAREQRQEPQRVTAADVGVDEGSHTTPSSYGAVVDSAIAGWSAARADIAPAKRERVFRALYGALFDGLCLDVGAMFRAAEAEADEG